MSYLHLFDHIQAFDNVAKDDMNSVEPVGLFGTDEKLRAVGVGARVGHGQDAAAGVLEHKVLVVELVSVDALAARAVAAREIPALAHELRNDAVKRAALVAVALFVRAQLSEILGRHGNDVGAELNDDTARLTFTNTDVHVNARVRFDLLGGETLSDGHFLDLGLFFEHR